MLKSGILATSCIWLWSNNADAKLDAKVSPKTETSKRKAHVQTHRTYCTLTTVAAVTNPV